MTNQATTTRTHWDEACTELADATAKLATIQAGNDDDHPAEDAALHAARLALLAAPAPDAEAVAVKLAHLVGLAVEEETGGSVDNLADVQWLLDDARCTDSLGHLVSLWQDVLAVAGIEHPVRSLVRLIDRPWPEMAAAYRAAHAIYMAAHAGPDDIEDGAAEEAERLIKPVYAAMLRYPVWNVEQIAEKAELIALDCRDEGKALEALTADAIRAAKL